MQRRSRSSLAASAALVLAADDDRSTNRASRAAFPCAASELVGRPARLFVRRAADSGAGRTWRTTRFPSRSVSRAVARGLDAGRPQRPAESVPGRRRLGPAAEPVASGARRPASRTAPDGTIWVADRCGNSGAGGTTCSGRERGGRSDLPARSVRQGAEDRSAPGLFVSPHKLTVDKDGNLWLADNGAHQVFKLDQSGKVLMTLGKKGVAGRRQRRVRRTDRGRRRRQRRYLRRRRPHRWRRWPPATRASSSSTRPESS